MDALEWIQHWYLKQCDGNWEHEYGIRIETLDNPGWAVMISLEDTSLKGKTFATVDVKRSKTDWLFCEVGYVQERQGLHFL